MPSREGRACPRRTLPACAITSLVLLVGLLMFVVIYVTLSWQDLAGEHSRTRNLTHDQTDDVFDDCRSKAAVVNDKAEMQKCDAMSTNFSQAWNNAEQEAQEPAHNYMEKHHSISIYMYTSIMLQPVKQDLEATESTGKPLKETFEPRSLYFSLSEAIQIMRHSQVTCQNTKYSTGTLFNLNIHNKLIRFGTFILGFDRWNFTRNASCFEVYTCFGADVTHYSALKLNSQVLIPPYEVFRVTDIEKDTKRCKVIYRLKSNLNCIYDRESNTLHPISALPVEGFWLIFSITFMIIVSLLLPFVISKVLENRKKSAVCRAPSLDNQIYYPARVEN